MGHTSVLKCESQGCWVWVCEGPKCHMEGRCVYMRGGGQPCAKALEGAVGNRRILANMTCVTLVSLGTLPNEAALAEVPRVQGEQDKDTGEGAPRRTRRGLSWRRRQRH